MRIAVLVVVGLALGAGPVLADGLFTFQREPSGSAMTNEDFMCAAARGNPEHSKTPEGRAYVQKVCDMAAKAQQERSFEAIRQYMPVILPYRPPNIQDRLDEINGRLKTIEQQGR